MGNVNITVEPVEMPDGRDGWGLVVNGDVVMAMSSLRELGKVTLMAAEITRATISGNPDVP